MNGINGFSGETLKAIFCEGVITKGQTYTVHLTLTWNGVPFDVTGYDMYITFSPAVDCEEKDIVQVLIPIENAEEGKFLGFITDDITMGLPEGEIFISLKDINVYESSHIRDMVKSQVCACVNPKIAK